MELGLVKKVDIDGEMQQSYLDYAMSVIVARALPDARDGLKPVQRRILYAMAEMGIGPDGETKKSARIVGEVLGKYHPHGDMAVYEAMARLAQDFTIRYPLVDGQGNFGSVDGDPPAAMRYTEAKLTAFSMQLLAQIDQDTVDFTRNFDESLREPVVLPAAAPNLLVNGASGIAVGMATNIPPHNLGEVIDALVHLIHDWSRMGDIGVQDLMKFVKGPDFPTGGIIIQEGEQEELLTAYATGRGRIIVRGKVHVEEMGRGRNGLIITELPYLANKASLIERIAELVREGQLEGIADLRDESDRQGMRVVIELIRGNDTDKVLRELYKRTPLQTTFGMNMLALVEGEPRLLSLKQALRVYLEHRINVVHRRSEFELDRVRKRLHILEGLRIALQNLDEVISLIKSSPDAEKAKEKLCKRYRLSPIQALSILDMQLRRLAALERKKIEKEYKDLLTRAKELESLLRSPRKIRQQVENELLELKQIHSDRRRTQIASLGKGDSSRNLLTASALTPAHDLWIGITANGTIGRKPGEKPPRLSGRAAPLYILKADTRHIVYLVTSDGKAATVLAESLPEVEKFSDGCHFSKICPLGIQDRLAGIFTLPGTNDAPLEGGYLIGVSRLGMVKRSSLVELPLLSSQPFLLMKINPGDELIKILLTRGDATILLVTSRGMAIRFSEEEVRPMGLIAAGVAGMKLKNEDQVVTGITPQDTDEVLFVASSARAWRIPAISFPLQGRYGQGVTACKLVPGEWIKGAITGKRTQAGILHYLKAASEMVRVDSVPAMKRQGNGKAIVEMKPTDLVTGMTMVQNNLVFWSNPKEKRNKKPA